jgi:hypothetical protein
MGVGINSATFYIVCSLNDSNECIPIEYFDVMDEDDFPSAAFPTITENDRAFNGLSGKRFH